jgi:hypothetical protein
LSADLGGEKLRHIKSLCLIAAEWVDHKDRIVDICAFEKTFTIFDETFPGLIIGETVIDARSLKK